MVVRSKDHGNESTYKLQKVYSAKPSAKSHTYVHA